MRLEERLDYPATPDVVYAMVTDKEFRDGVCAASGALSWSVEVDRTGGGASLTVRRVMPADLPAAARRLLGETVEVIQTEQWEPPRGEHRRAEVLVEIAGQPAKMIGTATLDPTGEGSAFVLAGDVKVRIPLVGHRLEREVARGIRLALGVEYRQGMAYLA